VCVYICMCVCVCEYVYVVCVCLCVYMCVCVCVCVCCFCAALYGPFSPIIFFHIISLGQDYKEKAIDTKCVFLFSGQNLSEKYFSS